MSSPFYYFFFFHDTTTTEIYTLSLHDALPIWALRRRRRDPARMGEHGLRRHAAESVSRRRRGAGVQCGRRGALVRDRCPRVRSEEHTSELQSRRDLVCRLLLEKKKIIHTHHRL